MEPDGRRGPQSVYKPMMKQRSAIVVLLLTNLSHRLVKASGGRVSVTPSGSVTQLHVPFLHGTRFHGFAAALESNFTWSPGILLGHVWWLQFKAGCFRLPANGLAHKDGFFDTNKVNPITVLSILLWLHKPVLILMSQNALLVIWSGHLYTYSVWGLCQHQLFVSSVKCT